MNKEELQLSIFDIEILPYLPHFNTIVSQRVFWVHTIWGFDWRRVEPRWFSGKSISECSTVHPMANRPLRHSRTGSRYRSRSYSI